MLRPTRQWRGHSAGQFVRIGVVINGIRHTRCYSPVGSAHRADGRIQLTVKAHPQGLVSQYLYRHAEPGLVVSLTKADGDFTLPRPRPDNIVFLSGGSGITPVLSMLRTLIDERYAGRIAFLHYATGPDAIAHRAELEAIAARHGNVALGFGYPRQLRGELTGYFDIDHLAAVAPWYRDAHGFVCGPPRLMSSAATVFGELGIGDRLVREEFTTTLLPTNTETAEGEVTFAASGIAAANTGATLLEQAEAAGLSPEHGCRMGICYSCVAVKRSGCTRDLRTGEIDAAEDRRIQLCVNAPVGDVSIDI
jgi:ferredoxin-NADP reductase